jgi:hypothetical protein
LLSYLVENLKGRYIGQKLIKLVTIKTDESIKPIIAADPLIRSKKYKVIIVIAKSILTIRSEVPMFFFIKTV